MLQLRLNWSKLRSMEYYHQIFWSEFSPRSNWLQNSSRILVGIPFHSLKQLALFYVFIFNNSFFLSISGKLLRNLMVLFSSTQCTWKNWQGAEMWPHEATKSTLYKWVIKLIIWMLTPGKFNLLHIINDIEYSKTAILDHRKT